MQFSMTGPEKGDLLLGLHGACSLWGTNDIFHDLCKFQDRLEDSEEFVNIYKI
jgi:hypothetical protein